MKAFERLAAPVTTPWFFQHDRVAPTSEDPSDLLA